MNAGDRMMDRPEAVERDTKAGSLAGTIFSTAIDLLHPSVPHAARILVAQETGLPPDQPAAELVRAALQKFPRGLIRDPRLRLLAMAITHLLLQVPHGEERDRLTDLVEEVVARCRMDPTREALVWS